jgi:uncharacterized protein (DUF488 family)
VLPKNHNDRTGTSLTVLTVGHSTRTIEDFVRILQANGAQCVADVRTIPRSRHNPQFNQDCLPRSLDQAGIGYVHLGGLGGLRHTTRQSQNLGWRNESFRGFADYMQTREFGEALAVLIRLAGKERIAVMCAEAIPWVCHRSLIADALVVRGVQVRHILSLSHCEPHRLTSFAIIRGLRVTYPAEIVRTKQIITRRHRNRRSVETGANRAFAEAIGQTRSAKRQWPIKQNGRRMAGRK